MRQCFVAAPHRRRASDQCYRGQGIGGELLRNPPADSPKTASRSWVALLGEPAPSGESTQQQGPTLIDVFAHLGDERIDRFKLQFIAQVSDELNGELLTVEIALEIDEMRFEQ